MDAHLNSPTTVPQPPTAPLALIIVAALKDSHQCVEDDQPHQAETSATDANDADVVGASLKA